MYLITIYTKGGNTLTFTIDDRFAFFDKLIDCDKNSFIRVRTIEDDIDEFGDADGADEYVKVSSIELISVEEAE